MCAGGPRWLGCFKAEAQNLNLTSHAQDSILSLPHTTLDGPKRETIVWGLSCYVDISNPLGGWEPDYD